MYNTKRITELVNYIESDLNGTEEDCPVEYLNLKHAVREGFNV
jgi:hypothetical protein